MPRVLFGPVTREFADRFLHSQRHSSEYFAFGRDVDLEIGPKDRWTEVVERLPRGWVPELVVLWLPYACPPSAVWESPVPVVGLAPDWNLLWHGYRHVLPLCDAVLTDRPGVEALHREGIGQAHTANLFGLGREYFDEWNEPEAERDIDVLFVGNMSPAVQRERAPWLKRLAEFGDQYHVLITGGVFGSDYRRLLRRAKIVFNRGIRGECNQRAFETPACGALLFQEAENHEVSEYLTPWVEYVPYTSKDLEPLLQQYLRRDDERKRVADAARRRIVHYPFEALLTGAIARLFEREGELLDRMNMRLTHKADISLAGSAWLGLTTQLGSIPELDADLEAAGRWHEAALHTQFAVRAETQFARAAVSNRVAAAAWAEVLARLGRTDEAVAAARDAIKALSCDPSLSAEEAGSPPYPGHFDIVRVEWERAAWSNAGDSAAEKRAKRDLLLWRLNSLQAEWTDDLAAYRAAAELRPDLPSGRAAYGCALARARRPVDAIVHLRAAVEANPFDRLAARAYHQCLHDLGEAEAVAAHAEAQRRLARVALGHVRSEPWFAAETVPEPHTGVQNQNPITSQLSSLGGNVGERSTSGERSQVGSIQASYRQTGGTMRVGPGRMRIALTMIVKNEEHNLPACLSGVQGLFDDMIVVDTGSTDRTRELAASFGARVADFSWEDDFAAARNVALDAARGDFVFWLDADDRVDPANRSKLVDLCSSLRDEHAAYVVKCRCVPEKPGGTATLVDHVRLFRLRPDVRWSYRVHEQILPALRRTGADVRWSDVVVDHVGYVDADLRSKKLLRDLRLLELEHAADPNEPFVLFNLGSVYLELGRDLEALDSLEKSLSGSQPTDSIVRKLYAQIGQCHRRRGRRGDALDAVRSGRMRYPDDAELLFLEGLIRREVGDTVGAERAFHSLLTGSEGDHFASVDAALRGSKARHQLALLYSDQGRRHEAEAQWRHALIDDPTFFEAQIGLGELALKYQDWAALERSVVELAGEGPAGQVEAAALSARGSLARSEYAVARAVLKAASDRWPESVTLRLLLSYAWLQEGADEASAERALREVLALDHSHREARHNLEVLLRRQGRWLEGIEGNEGESLQADRSPRPVVGKWLG